MALLPPFLAVESEPLDAAQLDEFADAVAVVVAGSNLSVTEAVKELTDYPWTDDEPAPVTRWQITGTDTAAWAMAKLAEVEHKRRAAIEQAQEWRERIDAWEQSQLAPLEARASFFAHHLERYALALREADPKAKSLSLPSGTVKTREAGPRFVVIDEIAAAKWAADTHREEFGQIVKTTQKVILTGLKQFVKAAEVDGGWAAYDGDGAVVPGVEVEPPTVTAKAVPDVE